MLFRSTDVIKNLRSYIKNESGEAWKKIRLNENISSVLNIFGFDLLQNYQINVSIDETLMIEGSEIKLFQLWSNLIKNAMEALKEQEDKKINIFSVTKDNVVMVCFENNGPVIPSKDLDNIFKIFYSTKEKDGGSGLGLSIVKRIVREHGATIEVTSGPGKTNFNISFPLVTN